MHTWWHRGLVGRGLRNKGSERRALTQPAPNTYSITYTQLGDSAKFRVSSLEAKVVVHFGPRLEHYVRVPLHNKVRPSVRRHVYNVHPP